MTWTFLWDSYTYLLTKEGYDFFKIKLYLQEIFMSHPYIQKTAETYSEINY